MSYFFTFLVQPLLPLVMLLSIVWVNKKPISVKPILCLTTLGFTIGTIFSLSFLVGQKALFAFHLALLLFYVLFYVGQFSSHFRLERTWSFLLAFAGGTLWGQDPNIRLITHTDVINTMFLLNVSAVILGLLFCVLIFGYVIFLFRQIKMERNSQSLQIIFTTSIVFFLLLPLSGNVLLNLMKLQILDLTTLRLSFVAKVDNLSNYSNYINGLILFLLLIVFTGQVYLPRRKGIITSDLIIKRQKQALLQRAKCGLTLGVTLLFTLFSVTLYWYNVASLPPALSESTIVTLKDDNAIHIPIESVKDGDLHRFLWVASDGRAIRFFIINRSQKKLNLATVFDACLLCGDSGYVVDGDKLMCVACGVRLFIPSVGKAGGCNPVPIENWREEKGEVVIPKSALLAGANYFSTVLEMEVEDPVSHQKLTNKQANHRYDYNGNTYFFVSEHNQNLFRDTPEAYLNEQK